MKYLLKKILFAALKRFFGKSFSKYQYGSGYPKYKYFKPKKKKGFKYMIAKKFFN